MYPVRGYYKPESSFHTISEWEQIASEFLKLQKQGFDTRGGKISDNSELVGLINKYFSHQLYIETEQYEDLTKKNVLDFIEDFVNHRVWGMKEEFRKFIVNIDNDKVSFFQSRGAIEPYVLLDDQFTKDTYGDTNIEVVSMHLTTKEGARNIIDSIKEGYHFGISTFTSAEKDFFRPESNIFLKLKGTLLAAFQSDAKTFATDKGNRAANMFRFSYPDNENNLCKDWEKCRADKTHLWNEIIMKPTEVLDYKIINKY